MFVYVRAVAMVRWLMYSRAHISQCTWRRSLVLVWMWLKQKVFTSHFYIEFLFESTESSESSNMKFKLCGKSFTAKWIENYRRHRQWEELGRRLLEVNRRLWQLMSSRWMKLCHPCRCPTSSKRFPRDLLRFRRDHRLVDVWLNNFWKRKMFLGWK